MRWRDYPIPNMIYCESMCQGTIAIEWNIVSHPNSNRKFDLLLIHCHEIARSAMPVPASFRIKMSNSELSISFWNDETSRSIVHYCSLRFLSCKRCVDDLEWHGMWMCVCVCVGLLLAISLLCNTVEAFERKKSKSHARNQSSDGAPLEWKRNGIMPQRRSNSVQKQLFR